MLKDELFTAVQFRNFASIAFKYEKEITNKKYLFRTNRPHKLKLHN